MAKKKKTGPPQLAKLKRSALNSAHITTNTKTSRNVEEAHGIFADRDELDGPEYRHAVNSPPKNGRRLDSKVSVAYKFISILMSTSRE